MNGSVIISQAETLPFLPALYAWGIEVIRFIQTARNPGLTAVMKAVSVLGSEYFYIPVVTLLFWCWNEKKGFRLGLLIIISAWINTVLKVLFGQPRPFHFDPALGLAFEATHGFPSGHAQTSTVFWLAAAFYMSRRFGQGGKIRFLLFWICGTAAVLLIGFSRLYLGVHFPTDVFGGWAAACIILVLFYVLEKPSSALLLKGGQRVQCITAALASLFMNGLHPADTSLSALLLGFGAGYSLMKNRFPFAAKGGAASKGEANSQGTEGSRPGLLHLALRALIGTAVTCCIYIGLKFVLPGEDSLVFNTPVFAPYYELSRFVRYGLLGLWVSVGAPKFFSNLNLASSEKPPDSPERE